MIINVIILFIYLFLFTMNTKHSFTNRFGIMVVGMIALVTLSNSAFAESLGTVSSYTYNLPTDEHGHPYRVNTGRLAPLRYKGYNGYLRGKDLFPYYGSFYAMYSPAELTLLKRKYKYTNAYARENNTVYGYPNHVVRNGQEKYKGDQYLDIIEKNNVERYGDSYLLNTVRPLFKLPLGYNETATAGVYKQNNSDLIVRTYYTQECADTAFEDCAYTLADTFASNMNATEAPSISTFKTLITGYNKKTTVYLENFKADDKMYYTLTAHNNKNDMVLRIEAEGDVDMAHIDTTMMAQVFSTLNF